MISLSNTDLPQADRQVLECGMQVPSHDNIVPAFALTFPTNNAFVVAQGAAGTSFSALVYWLTRSPSAHSG